MKTLVTAVAITLTSLGSFAQDVTVFNDNFVSTKTRAEVRAEVASAAARGELPAAGDIDRDPALASTWTRTRAAVKAELAQAFAHGEQLSHGDIH